MLGVSEDIFKGFLGILIALAVVVLAYFQWSFTYWKRKGVAHPPASIPYGNVGDIFRQKTTLGEALRNAYAEYKGRGLRYCGLYFFSGPVFLAIDLELIRRILTSDFQHFTDHGVYVNEKREPLTGNLFNLRGLKWRNLRAKLTPTFTSGKMKIMFETLVDCTRGLLGVIDEVVENESVLDVRDAIGRYTTDVIGSCAFGLDCNSLKHPDSEFRRHGKQIFQFGKKQAIIKFLSMAFPKLLEKLSFTVLDEEASKFFMSVAKQTVKYREENDIIRQDFMQLLIQLKNNIDVKNGESDDGKTLTMNEIAAQAFVFFIAGFDTSSTTLTFCFYELASNPTIQEKLRAEVMEVLDKYHGELSYDAIMEMSYMDKCVQETLRKYPPAPVLMRECTKTYPVPDSDLVIDKGTKTFVSVLGIHHDPEYYPDPEKFVPERFSAENRSKQHPFAWIPFGEGPRTCIGLRFAIMQIKVTLAILLNRYKFTLNPKTPTPLVLKFGSGVLSVRGDVWLNVEKVSDKD